MTLCPNPRTFTLTLKKPSQQASTSARATIAPPYNPSQARTGVDLAPLKAALTAANSKQMDTSMLSAPVAVMQATLEDLGFGL